jgi:myosin heavy subunit
MNEMNLLNEAEIMYNLKHRYTQELFATYIGPTLLVM